MTPHRPRLEAGRLLATRDAAAKLIERHPVQLRVKVNPVACDVRSKLPLYDVDEASEAFRNTPRRQRAKLQPS